MIATESSFFAHHLWRWAPPLWEPNYTTRKQRDKTSEASISHDGEQKQILGKKHFHCVKTAKNYELDTWNMTSMRSEGGNKATTWEGINLIIVFYELSSGELSRYQIRFRAVCDGVGSGAQGVNEFSPTKFWLAKFVIRLGWFEVEFFTECHKKALEKLHWICIICVLKLTNCFRNLRIRFTTWPEISQRKAKVST